MKPGFFWARLERGVAYYYEKEYKRAVADLSKVIAVEPKNILAYVFRGNAHYQMNELDLARRNWEQAVELDPDGELGKYARDELKMLDEEGD